VAIRPEAVAIRSDVEVSEVATVAIIGDGPAGLSAALFLARADHETIVFGTDQTAMHYAQLHNYLGIEDVHGSDFQTVARRQAAAAGADLRDAEVTGIDRAGDDRFTVRTAEGELTADHVVLAGGKAAQQLATGLGMSVTDGRVTVDTEYRTDVDRVYAVGRLVRPDRSQAIISAGAGATVALDILSREAGRDVHDWDSPPQA
jgi:thioredoxin reductase (NADPH)